MNDLEKICHDIRLNIIELAYRAGKNSAHCGGSLSAVEILATLYHRYLKWDVTDLENRDRVIISKAHASLVQYCVLESVGRLTKEELYTFEQSGSRYTVHAHKDIEKGLEFSGGSLGLGMSYAVGVAYALKEKGSNARVYVLLGDGECDEGIVWEALMFAKHNALANLIVIVDHNHLQADGFIEDVLDTTNLADKFKAFGFQTIELNGHSIDELSEAYKNLSETMPTAIVAETTKGKGISFMENKYNWHFTVLPEGKYKKALTELKAKVYGA
jgi:transketolase